MTNVACPNEACRFYAKRFKTGTSFSDEKGCGFNLQKRYLSDPKRLNRLLIAASLACFWIVGR
jgi:hypothetical protein